MEKAKKRGRILAVLVLSMIFIPMNGKIANAATVAKIYKISYELNGGKNHKDNPSSYSSSKGTVAFKSPTKKGYIFVGWYTSSKYKTKITKISKGKKGNYTLYAKWNPITYTISYNRNGGTGSIAQRSCSYNSTVTLATSGFSKSGYLLAGWSTTKNGAIVYKKGQKVKNLTSNNKKKITLYAVWQKKLYKHMNSNFGTHNTSSRTGSIQYIVIHYTATPNKDAKAQIATFNNRSYRVASADYFVGYNGDIWQYNPNPTKRYCWAVGGKRVYTKGGSLYGIARNLNSIHIEMCVNLQSGAQLQPNVKGWILKDATYNKTIKLTKELMLEYNIPASRVIRHYDVTGKLCPGIIGWNEDSGSTEKWQEFKSRISQ